MSQPISEFLCSWSPSVTHTRLWQLWSSNALTCVSICKCKPLFYIVCCRKALFSLGVTCGVLDKLEKIGICPPCHWYPEAGFQCLWSLPIFSTILPHKSFCNPLPRLEWSSPRDRAPGFESAENSGPAVCEEQAPEAHKDSALWQRQLHGWGGQPGAEGEPSMAVRFLPRVALSAGLFIERDSYCTELHHTWKELEPFMSLSSNFVFNLLYGCH